MPEWVKLIAGFAAIVGVVLCMGFLVAYVARQDAIDAAEASDSPLLTLPVVNGTGTLIGSYKVGKGKWHPIDTTTKVSGIPPLMVYIDMDRVSRSGPIGFDCILDRNPITSFEFLCTVSQVELDEFPEDLDVGGYQVDLTYPRLATTDFTGQVTEMDAKLLKWGDVVEISMRFKAKMSNNKVYEFKIDKMSNYISGWHKEFYFDPRIGW